MDSAIPILLFVARSKLVPDFALTIHFLHLVATSIYTKAVPTNLFWWALQAISAALMTSLGVWACRYRELKPISFGGKANAGKKTAAQANGDIEMDDNIRGESGRGRNVDGGPSYEAVSADRTANMV